MGAPRIGQLLAPLILAALAWPASAQPSPLQLGACRGIQDNAARLKCFDDAMAPASGPNAPPSASPWAAAKPKERWEIRQSKSPIDDRPEIAGALVARDGKTVLIARCKEGSTELAVVPDEFLGSSGERRAILRINDGAAVAETWSSSNGGKGAFSRSAIATLRALPDNGTFFLRINDFRGVGHDATFDLGNISEVRTAISETCRWSSTPAPASKTKR